MKIIKQNERDMIRELDAYFNEARRVLLEESSKSQDKSSSKSKKKQKIVKKISN